MSMLLFFGISAGIAFALFFGNFLYKISNNNMVVPNAVNVLLGLFVFLPLAAFVIPEDGRLELL